MKSRKTKTYEYEWSIDKTFLVDDVGEYFEKIEGLKKGGRHTFGRGFHEFNMRYKGDIQLEIRVGLNFNPTKKAQPQTPEEKVQEYEEFQNQLYCGKRIITVTVLEGSSEKNYNEICKKLESRLSIRKRIKNFFSKE